MLPLPDLPSRCSILLKRWRDQSARLKAEEKHDRMEGLTHTADAIQCAHMAIDACIAGLEEEMGKSKSADSSS